MSELEKANKEIERLKKVCTTYWELAQDQITLNQKKRKEIIELRDRIKELEDGLDAALDCMECRYE